MKWIKYSGASITFTFNPLHWAWRPIMDRSRDEWAGPREHTLVARWLFASVRVWIDDGSW